MDQETLTDILDLGKDSWNQWRTDNPNVDVNFSGMDFSGKDFEGYDFSECNLSYANFSKAKLASAKFISANLGHAKLNFSELEGANFIAADLSFSDLTLAHLRGAKFLTALLNQANFSYVDFTGHSLQGMDFRRAKLCGANLRNQNLSSMDFAEADLSQADLTESALEEANLQGANLARAILDNCRLTGANLKEVNFAGARLAGQNFAHANLIGAHLEECDCRSVNFEGAHLDNAVLTGAKLFDAKISGWSIKNIRCENAFWDKEGVIITRYRANEFEKLYAESIEIELRYDKFMSAHELSTLPFFIEHLEAGHWGIKLRLKSIVEEAGGSRVRIVVQDTGGHNPESLENDLKEEASQLLAAQFAMRQDRKLLPELKDSLSQIKNKFWPRLLELAAENETGQVRMFTVMIMDLKGFSKWKGDELNEKLTLFRGLIRPILKRWKASYPNMEGDSLRASFQNAPVGVACACMIRNVLDAAGFPCRIGIDLGEVYLQYNEVTEQTDLSGEAVSFSARLESLCNAGEVLISERVWHFVRRQEEYFSLEPRAVKLEKGVGNLRAGDKVHCYAVKMIKPLM